MATSAEHKQISERFLDHAEQEFERGDMLQASEKGWGALSHYVNSVAVDRGMPHGRHRHINSTATEMIGYLDDRKAPTEKLNSANVLHANFYEFFLTPEQVREGLDSARQLIEDLKVAEKRMPRPDRGRNDDGPFGERGTRS